MGSCRLCPLMKLDLPRVLSEELFGRGKDRLGLPHCQVGGLAGLVLVAGGFVRVGNISENKVRLNHKAMTIPYNLNIQYKITCWISTPLAYPIKSAH
jgi:hypothetical protein